MLTVVALLIAAGASRLLATEAAARGAALEGVRSGFDSAVHLVHLKWRAQGGSGARVLLDGGGAVRVNESGWPSLEPDHPEQDSAADLHALLLGAPLGPGWAAGTSRLGSGRACFALPGPGGGSFWYDPASGRVSAVQAQDSINSGRLLFHCNSWAERDR